MLNLFIWNLKYPLILVWFNTLADERNIIADSGKGLCR